MLTIDHQGLIDGDPVELKKLRNLLLAAEAGRVLEAAIFHETDNSCCLREPWEQTLGRIVTALRHPGPILHLTAEDTP